MADLSPTHFFANSFLSKASYGLLKANRFEVRISGVPVEVQARHMNLMLETDTDVLKWNCLAASCPNIGVELQQTNVNARNRFLYKLRTDADISLQFLETSDLLLRRFFNDWLKLAYDPQTMGRIYPVAVKANRMEIRPLSQDGTSVAFDVFEDVYPYEINNLDYNHGSEDTLLRTEVKFKFVFHDVIRDGEVILPELMVGQAQIQDIDPESY